MRYVDVNVFVYWLGNDPVFGDQATEILTRIEKGEKAVTSSLTLWLVHVLLSGLSERYSEERFVEMMKGLVFLRVEPLLFEDYGRALEYMKSYELDLEDALHLATALRLGVKEIYTNNGDFDRTSMRRVGFK